MYKYIFKKNPHSAWVQSLSSKLRSSFSVLRACRSCLISLLFLARDLPFVNRITRCHTWRSTKKLYPLSPFPDTESMFCSWSGSSFQSSLQERHIYTVLLISRGCEESEQIYHRGSKKLCRFFVEHGEQTSKRKCSNKY